MAITYISNFPSGGTSLGQSASDLVSLHGVTPVAQASAWTAISSVCVVAHSTAGFGFKTSATGNRVIAAIVACRTILVNKGLMA